MPIILGKVKKKSSKEYLYVDKMSQYGAVWQKLCNLLATIPNPSLYKRAESFFAFFKSIGAMTYKKRQPVKVAFSSFGTISLLMLAVLFKF